MLPSLHRAIFNLNEHFWTDSLRAAELPAQPLRRTSSSLVPFPHQHQRPLRRQDRPLGPTGQGERTLDICAQRFTGSATSDGGLLLEYPPLHADELEKTLNGPLSASLKAIESRGGSDGQLIVGILDAVKEVYSLHDRYICLFEQVSIIKLRKADGAPCCEPWSADSYNDFIWRSEPIPSWRAPSTDTHSTSCNHKYWSSRKWLPTTWMSITRHRQNQRSIYHPCDAYSTISAICGYSRNISRIPTITSTGKVRSSSKPAKTLQKEANSWPNALPSNDPSKRVSWRGLKQPRLKGISPSSSTSWMIMFTTSGPNTAATIFWTSLWITLIACPPSSVWRSALTGRLSWLRLGSNWVRKWRGGC